MSDLLFPQTFTVKTQDGTERTYLLSKFPAVAGREIVTQYPISAMPKLGDYKVNEDVMLKLMGYVGVQMDNGSVLRLSSRALIDNHIPDWETLARIEMAMMEYNVSFFGKGKSSLSLEAIIQKARPLITRILTDLSEQSSKKDEPRSTN